ncbi:hypothetical protein [Pelagimonas varians]|uniref:Uncharacterized protein n=1 Tax=Pelagimonas varians TaxID=696760 RepID=A0A238JZV7_9RHOB|nr:hypothetical protein [Pelagimonas varians]PYG33123.1 hypothetical protein C8N36_102118 [Pelagimonas varians]SMX35747.1 hypothetical protein PEV8663_00580 [Pelagimonas varians]
MKAATNRRRYALADQAEAMFVALRRDGADVQNYCDQLRGIDRSLPPEALQGALIAAASDLPKMSWADFQKEKGAT